MGITKGYACLDLESIPCQFLPEGARPEFDESEVKLGNLKDPFKIHEKMEAERLKFEEGLDKFMATNPDLLQIVCVAIKSPSGEILTWFAKDEEEEYGLLVEVWDYIREQYRQAVPFTGFNLIGFDLLALHRRAMFLDVSVAPTMAQNLLARQERNRHCYDLMELLGRRNPFSGKTDSINDLGYYLKRYGVGEKWNKMTGADVWPAFQEGRYDDIVKYCRHDVVCESALFERVSPWLLVPHSEKEEQPRKALAAVS